MLSMNTVYRNWLMIIIVSSILLSIITPNVGLKIGSRNASIIRFNGNILYVGGSGEGNYTRIQDAINNASDGDIIIVYPGIYKEHLVIEKAIRICGSGCENTFIIGISSGKWYSIKILHDNVNINNFTLVNQKNYGALIWIEGKNVTIEYNLIRGEIVVHACWVHIYKNVIKNAGIELGFSHSLVENNLIENAIYGIFLWGTNNKICGNIFRNCSTGTQIFRSQNIIKKNKFLNCSTGIGLEGNKNIIRFNEFVGNKYGISIYMGKNNLIYSNNFIMNDINADLEGWLADLPLINKWKENYWYNHKSSLPKIIFGRIILGGPPHHHKYFPWINIDWHPAIKPYEW